MVFLCCVRKVWYNVYKMQKEVAHMKNRGLLNRIFLILSLFVLIFGLAACSGGAQGGDAEKTADTAVTQASDSGGNSGSSDTAVSSDDSAETGTPEGTENEQGEPADKPFEPGTTGSSITPQKAPEDLVIGYRASIADTNTWNYFITDAYYSDQKYQMVCREDPVGNIEVLYGLAQTDDYIVSINYVDLSFEKSGNRFLYFTIENGLTLHDSLFCFNLETLRFNEVLSEPCSNMVIFYDAPADIAGLGWVLYGDYILPIKLSDASSYEGMTKGIEDLGDMSDISYSFFFSVGSADEFKYSILDTLPDGVLQIQVVTFSPSAENPESRVIYNYDCVKQTIKKVG